MLDNKQVNRAFFTWRHGGHIGVPKQWHGGHVGVPRQPCGNWTLFLCKIFLLFQWISIGAGHVSENALYSEQDDDMQAIQAQSSPDSICLFLSFPGLF